MIFYIGFLGPRRFWGICIITPTLEFLIQTDGLEEYVRNELKTDQFNKSFFID